MAISVAAKMGPPASQVVKQVATNRTRCSHMLDVEQLAHLVEEALAPRVADGLAGLVGELLEELALARGQVGRGLDDDADVLVAARLAVALGDALAAQAEGAPRLRALGDAHLDLAIERRDLDVGAERGLREADRD